MAFKLSDSKSRLLALMGSGILVGTALAIIIPEGIDSIYAQPNQFFNDPKLVSETSDVTGVHSASSSSKPTKINLQQDQQSPVETWTIGFSLIAGFVLMLLIDQFSIYQSGQYSTVHNHSSDHNHRQHSDYMLANQDDDELDNVVCDNDGKRDAIDLEIASNGSETKIIKPDNDATHRIPIRSLLNNKTSNLPPLGGAETNRINMSTAKVTPTLGLVIHAAADGIALGAAATTSHRDVEMIIFLAIMLHKGPAAFSLVVFLLHRGLKHSVIRQHLLAFSLSAPLAALVTYFGLSQSGKEALRRNNATGIAMLFSAGTFLYVATVHVLPELVHNRLLSPRELTFLVGGAFLPIILAQSI